jgi:hypothetical protein
MVFRQYAVLIEANRLHDFFEILLRDLAVWQKGSLFIWSHLDC